MNDNFAEALWQRRLWDYLLGCVRRSCVAVGCRRFVLCLVLSGDPTHARDWNSARPGFTDCERARNDPGRWSQTGNVRLSPLACAGSRCIAIALTIALEYQPVGSTDPVCGKGAASSSRIPSHSDICMAGNARESNDCAAPGLNRF